MGIKWICFLADVVIVFKEEFQDRFLATTKFMLFSIASLIVGSVRETALQISVVSVILLIILDFW